MSEFSSRIKELRSFNSITQRDLAKYLNTKCSTISNWESRGNEPTADYIIKIADYFGVSTDYLLGRENDEGNIITVSPGLTDEEQRLVDYYRALPPELRAGVMSYTRTFFELDNKAKRGYN